jgi:DNA repair protein RadA/Sms
MGYGMSSINSEILRLSEVDDSSKPTDRYSTGYLDNVLGGGLVSDSVTMLVGPPGIGKSTLSLQIASALSLSGLEVLYITGEESASQVKSRAKRLHTDCSGVYILQCCDIAKISQTVRSMKPDVFIVDSLQTTEYIGLKSSPGSPKQMELCATELTNIAKSIGSACIMLGHVVKSGMAAGPKKIEHIVDAVVRFEKKMEDRIIHCSKNRFGTTDEVCILSMEADGLHIVEKSDQLIEDTGVAFSFFENKNQFDLLTIQTSICYYALGKFDCNFYPSKELTKVGAIFAAMQIPIVRWHTTVSSLGSNARIKDCDAELGIYTSILCEYLEHDPTVKVAALGSVTLAGRILPCRNEDERINLAISMGFDKVIGNFSTRRKDSRIVHIDSVRDIARCLSY